MILIEFRIEIIYRKPMDDSLKQKMIRLIHKKTKPLNQQQRYPMGMQALLEINRSRKSKIIPIQNKKRVFLDIDAEKENLREKTRLSSSFEEKGHKRKVAEVQAKKEDNITRSAFDQIKEEFLGKNRKSHLSKHFDDQNFHKAYQRKWGDEIFDPNNTLRFSTSELQSISQFNSIANLEASNSKEKIQIVKTPSFPLDIPGTVNKNGPKKIKLMKMDSEFARVSNRKPLIRKSCSFDFNGGNLKKKGSLSTQCFLFEPRHSLLLPKINKCLTLEPQDANTQEGGKNRIKEFIRLFEEQAVVGFKTNVSRSYHLIKEKTIKIQTRDSKVEELPRKKFNLSSLKLKKGKKKQRSSRADAQLQEHRSSLTSARLRIAANHKKLIEMSKQKQINSQFKDI